jgi:hypothetical protein
VVPVTLLRKCCCAEYRIDTVPGSAQSVVDGPGDR